MDKENLLKMANHLETISDDMFNMKKYRNTIDGDMNVCNTVACVIGHCTVLDTKENLSKFIISSDEVVGEFFSFYQWAIHFTKVKDDKHYAWLFGGDWFKIDNTRKGAIDRIRNFVANDGMTRENNQFFKENFWDLTY